MIKQKGKKGPRHLSLYLGPEGPFLFSPLASARSKRPDGPLSTGSSSVAAPTSSSLFLAPLTGGPSPVRCVFPLLPKQQDDVVILLRSTDAGRDAPGSPFLHHRIKSREPCSALAASPRAVLTLRGGAPPVAHLSPTL
jgi:hypothetical protein